MLYIREKNRKMVASQDPSLYARVSARGVIWLDAYGHAHSLCDDYEEDLGLDEGEGSKQEKEAGCFWL